MKQYTMTLDRLLSRMSDEALLNINSELVTGLVPASGYARKFCRKINSMIDAGLLCINPKTHRKVYLPTAAQEVRRELSRRYQLLLEDRTNIRQQDCATLFEHDLVHGLDGIEQATLYGASV